MNRLPDHRRNLSYGKFAVVVLVVFALLMVDFASAADSSKKRRRNSSRNRRAAVAAQARKQQMISSIRRQVASARKVLVAAESQTKMSQANVDQAISELSSLHDQIENAHLDVQQTHKTLRDIEAEILSEQKPDSEFGLAKSKSEAAKDEVHRAIHRVHPWTDKHELLANPAPLTDLSKLSADQRQQVEQDKAYQLAKERMKKASRETEQIRQHLYQTDSDWVVAHQEYLESKRRSRSGSQQAGTVGSLSLDDRQDLRRARNVAASARSVIAQGEARLRQLGAGKKSSSSKKKSKSKSQQKRKKV